MGRSKTPRYPPQLRDPDGKKLCRGCLAPVPKGRISWCSRKCYLQHCPTEVASRVELRDNWICQCCRRDVKYLQAAYSRMRQRLYHYRWKDRREVLIKTVLRLGWPSSTQRSWFELDHIIPVAEGGKTVDENMQLLCVPCHKKKTAEWRRQRAAGLTGIVYNTSHLGCQKKAPVFLTTPGP